MWFGKITSSSRTQFRQCRATSLHPRSVSSWSIWGKRSPWKEMKNSLKCLAGEWSIRKPSEDCWLLGHSTLPPVFLANLGQHPCYGVSTHEKKHIFANKTKKENFMQGPMAAYGEKHTISTVCSNEIANYLHFWEIDLGGSAIGSWEMKLLANGFVWKLAKWWDPIFNDLLVAQELWGRKEARSSVKVTNATYGWQQFHIPA